MNKRYSSDGLIHDNERLAELQALPLHQKIGVTIARVTEWYEAFDGNIFVSLSGGKDSTVLWDIVHKLFPDVPAVFSNTGLEYPEISEFAKGICTDVVSPKMAFTEVIKNYGYPIISKEVSGAIYYARRNNCSQTVNVEREREREREREQQPRNRVEETGTHRQSTDSQSQAILGRQTIWKRMELLGIRPTCSRAEWWRSHTHTHTHTPTQDAQPTENAQNSAEQGETHIPQKQVRRKMLMGSFGSTDGTEKSKFNKEKWLPLVYTPFKISHYCCNVMKKSPIGVYQRYTKRYPIVGTMTEESRMRKQAWLRHGCNAFNSKKKVSSPMSFWTEQDVLEYIKTFDVDICSVYGEIETLDNGKLHCTGCQRTGCIFCGFGCHLEKGSDRRFLRLKETHPKLYDYCMRGGKWIDNPDYIPDLPEYDGAWKNWNPEKIWIPDKGLGMAFVFDTINEIYGEDFIAY